MRNVLPREARKGYSQCPEGTSVCIRTLPFHLEESVMNHAICRGVFVAVLLTIGLAGTTPAITIDGTADPEYGDAKSVQITETNFGNATMGLVDFANGSELDQAFALMDEENLYLLFAGNLESNFNKLEIFFDTRPGGQNRIRGDNPRVGADALNRMGTLTGGDGSFGPNGPGLKFDDEFEPDYILDVTVGARGGGVVLEASYGEMLTNGGGFGIFLGVGGAVTDGTLAGSPFAESLGIKVTINNSNTAGVNNGCQGSSGGGVMTGIEVKVPLATLDSPSDCIKVCAFVNGLFHDFVSNQVAGTLVPPQCNLGEPRLVDFSALVGDQFFEVCPVPVQVESHTWGRIKADWR